MNLKNIWIVKQIHKLRYPRKILPKRRYKLLIDFDFIKANQQSYLIRRSNLPFDETFYQNGNKYEINEDAIVKSAKDIQGLSTNIAGAYFKEAHLKFRLIMNTTGNNKWTKRRKVFLYKHLDSIDLLEGCPIYINVNKVHNFPHDYNRPDANKLQQLLTSLNIEHTSKIDSNKQTILNVPGKCVVKHDPLNLNYWHAEICLIDISTEEELNNKGSGWYKTYCQTVLSNYIAVNCMAKPLENNYKLAEHIFIHKNESN